ncbi:MAG: CpaF family protein, partial [Candidatus Omnitrophica bacterium]|nr:CpaF family protein [Candidatus Omnitrophota bacterium]
EDFQLKLKDIFVFRQKGIDADGNVIGNFEPTGHIPKSFEEFSTRGLDIDKDIFTAPPAKE